LEKTVLQFIRKDCCNRKMAPTQVSQGVVVILGLANYFRKFMDHFSYVVAPFTALTGATGKA
jgi:hypothetical protein